jgi:hypothetical protein
MENETQAIQTLQMYHDQAAKFVKKNYVTSDLKDFNIKVLATMNQIIELNRSQ